MTVLNKKIVGFKSSLGELKYRCGCGFGQMAKYSCKDGFVLIPKECKKRICQWNQNWSGKDDPSCKAGKKKSLGLIFFLILGLRIFFQNIKVGGGKKINIKSQKKCFYLI